MKNNRAFSTVACMDLGAEAVFSVAKEAGMSAVEIRMDKGTVFGLTNEELPSFRAMSEKCGVGICGIGTGIALKKYDEAALASAKDALHLASRIGAASIRIFPGSFLSRKSDVPVNDTEGMIRFLSELIPVSKETGVEIRIETHNEFSTGRSLKSILDAVPGVKIIWDVMHSIEMGETPEDTCSLIGDKITHVHIKDGRPYEDPDLISYYYTKLGEGTMPFERIFASLKNIGYKGFYSLEWENAWRKELLGMYENLRELLSNYNAFLDSFGL